MEIEARINQLKTFLPDLWVVASGLSSILYSNWFDLYKGSSHYHRRIMRGSKSYEHMVYETSIPVFRDILKRIIDISRDVDSYSKDPVKSYLISEEIENILMKGTNFYWIVLGAIEVLQNRK